MMARVIVTRPGTISKADRDELRSAGIVTIVTDSPDDVRFLQIEGEPMRTDDMLFAAMSGACESGFGREKFATIMLKLISEARARSKP